MKSLSETYVLASFMDLLETGHVNLNHFLQRESGQWSRRQQVKLIDTLLRGYPFPTIYAIKESEDNNDLTVLDGKQRITTLKEFILDGAFAFRCKEPIEIDGESYALDGLRYAEMPKAVQKKLGSANFNVVTFTGYTMEDVLEIFDRLNNGTPLTKAEKSKPLMGDRMIAKMKEIIAGGFFDQTGMTDAQKRKGECYTVLISCLMLLKEGATALSSSAIARFIEASRDALTDSDYDRLVALLSMLGDALGQQRALTKVSVAPIVAVMAPLTDEQQAAFLARLKTFFESPIPDEYHAFCVKSTDKAQVDNRIRFFRAMAE